MKGLEVRLCAISPPARLVWGVGFSAARRELAQQASARKPAPERCPSTGKIDPLRPVVLNGSGLSSAVAKSLTWVRFPSPAPIGLLGLIRDGSAQPTTTQSQPCSPKPFITPRNGVAFGGTADDSNVGRHYQVPRKPFDRRTRW